MAASWVPSTTEGSVLVDPLSNKLPHTEQLLSDNWIINAPQSEEGCLAKYGDSDPGSGCGYFWDSFFCWPPGDPETTIYVSCRAVLETMGVPVVNGSMAAGMDGLRAFRTCNASGHWSLGNWTNYTLCLDMLSDEAHDTLDHEPVPMAVIVGFSPLHRVHCVVNIHGRLAVHILLLQGIFVTVLYCFLNSDVRRVVRNCYLRTEARRSVRRPVRTKSSSSSLLAKQMTIRQQKKNGVHTLVLFNDGAKKGRSDNEPSFLHELSVQPPPSAIFSDTNLASTCSSSV
ncbi:hypothetical protein HDE_13020 [Halotydeus destructor]|nr:hypothetical protein HDE_13020 [Halotydeus destructor]